MPAYVIIGGQWGDEGKGKVVDLLSENAHVVARFNGGNNAGHTVINDLGEFRFHLLPVGILRPDVTSVIGNGVVVDPDGLLGELAELKTRSVDVSRLIISDKAHLVMPYHVRIDQLEEAIRAEGGGAIGTTGRGIGPAYGDKAARVGIRMGDILDDEHLVSRLKFVVEQKNSLIEKFYGGDPIKFEEIYEKCVSWRSQLSHMIQPIEPLIQETLSKEQNLLLEGAQGVMLDLDHGTYPYVTSSSPTVGGACSGIGISPMNIQGVAGVYKAYSTRVGSGPFPTELNDEIGEAIRSRAAEYGTTTGRARRCGWFDAVSARYSAVMNGMTSAILTRLDILDGFSSIKICVGYRLNGELTDRFPSSTVLLDKCEPVYEEVPGWDTPTQGARNAADLPAAAVSYVKRLEELIGCPVSMVSTGPHRDEVVVLKSSW